MKNVLVLTHAFYPLFHGGVPRIAKFCKYLPEFGWIPTIVTIDWRGRIANKSAVDVKDPCKVIRVNADLNEFESNKLTLFNRLTIHMRRYGRTIDDVMYKSEERELFIASRDVCTKFHFDLILASSFPQYIHRIAKTISKEFDIPWVADHRDIYGQEPVLEAGFRRISREYDIRMGIQNDLKNCRTASRVVTVSNGLSSILQERLEKQIDVVTNGFDDDDFVGVSVQTKNPKMTIVYAGSFFGNRSCTTFFTAIKSIVNKYPRIRERIRIEFYGSCCDMFYEKNPIANGLNDVIELNGNVDHRAAIQAICSADILYLISHQAKGIATGKIYEYLRAGKPIISVPGDNDVTDMIIRKSNAGKIAKDPEQVETILLDWFKEWETNATIKYDVNADYISQFNRKNLTNRLAEVFNQVIG